MNIVLPNDHCTVLSLYVPSTSSQICWKKKSSLQWTTSRLHPYTATPITSAQPRLPFCFPLTAANAGGASPNCCSQISILAGLNHSVLPSFVNGIRK
jgi:hypothetical protein